MDIARPDLRGKRQRRTILYSVMAVSALVALAFFVVRLKPAVPIARLLTVHWMPERLQREYRMKITPLNTGMFLITAGYTAMVYPHLPKRLRQAPSKFYMKDMKDSVSKIEKTGDWPRLKS